MPDVPVYVLTGFIESGKTTFMERLLASPDFITGEKTIILLCENGIEEVKDQLLTFNNAQVIKVESEADFTEDLLIKIDKEYEPERIIIEYNCMWSFDKLLNMKLPIWWMLSQIVCLVDASTFKMYMNNLRMLMAEQYKNADLVIFNRCNKDLNKTAVRGSIKAVNKKAQIAFELENGKIDDSLDELPFDIDAPVITIEEYDFALWYSDATSFPEKYQNKKIQLIGKVSPQKCPNNFFVLGRRAMTCCENDISFLPVICRYNSTRLPNSDQWIQINGKVIINYLEKFEAYMPVIVVESFEEVAAPSDELLYFI